MHSRSGIETNPVNRAARCATRLFADNSRTRQLSSKQRPLAHLQATGGRGPRSIEKISHVEQERRSNRDIGNRNGKGQPSDRSAARRARTIAASGWTGRGNNEDRSKGDERAVGRNLKARIGTAP